MSGTPQTSDSLRPGMEPQTAATPSNELAAVVDLLKRGAFGAFWVQVVGAAAGVLVHLAIARMIGADEYGRFAFVLSWIGVLAVVAQFGQDTSVVRFIPEYVHHGDWARALGLRRGVGLLVLANSILLALVGTIFIRVHFGPRNPLVPVFEIGFVLLPVLTQLQQSGALHRAFKKAVRASLYDTVMRPLITLGLCLACWWAFSLKLDAVSVSAISAVSAAASLAWSAVRLREYWPPGSRNEPARYDVRNWLRVGAQLSLLSIMMVASTRLGVLVIGGLLGTHDVGPYYGAAQLATFAAFGFNGVNTILAPLIAQNYAAGQMELLAVLLRRASRITFLATSALTLGLALSGKWALGLFGPQFKTAYIPLLILLVGQWLNASAGSVGFVLTMTRFQSQAPAIFSVGAMSNLLLAFALVPRWGMNGAAMATVAGWTVWNLIALVYTYRKLGINPTIFR